MQHLIRNVIQAVRMHEPQAQAYFEIVSKMARATNESAELQELGKVLQKILAGNQGPDLSHLPEELAKLVREELEK